MEVLVSTYFFMVRTIESWKYNHKIYDLLNNKSSKALISKSYFFAVIQQSVILATVSKYHTHTVTGH